MACYFYQFSKIKWFLISPFFKHSGICSKCSSLKSFKEAQARELNSTDTLFFWNMKFDPALLEWARNNGVDVRFVEDGFIRSVGLGSALSRPLSLVLDSRGLYFDPTKPSDLEFILQNHEFAEELQSEAERLADKICSLKLSKYNHQTDFESDELKPRNGQNIILVPGQVDDDRSVMFGGFGLTNLTLLQKVRSLRPDDYIVFKPHPDVLSKNRLGDMPDAVPLEFADVVIREASIDSLIGQVDEVHTMTSLVGFDALIRGKPVFTYGLPFYAGWGLTNDLQKSKSRTRKLSLNELVAGTLLVYPKYFNPYTGEETGAFEVVEYLYEQKQKLKANPFRRGLLRAQGVVLPKIRNLIKSLTKRSNVT